MSFMVWIQKLGQLLLCALINVSKNGKYFDERTDDCIDVSLVIGIEDFEVIGKFFDGFAVGRPRSDQFDLEDIVKKGVKDLNGLMKEAV